MRFLWAIFLAFSVVGLSHAAPADQSIAIETNKRTFILTVPVSRLTLSIPKGSLALKNNSNGGSTDNPRYFYLEDPQLHLIISGWFEPARGFTDFDTFWKSETDAWRQNGLPEPRNVSKEEIGNWDAIEYETAIPHGTNSHIRAHWVQAGTWIDIHFSLTSERSPEESRKFLRSVLGAVIVKEKAQ